MNNSLGKLILTSNKMIDIAKSMIRACQLKKNKVTSPPRFVVSFFLRRGLELFESFLILIKENRIIDSALLLRSLLEVGINLGYIFAKDIYKTEKEIRTCRYLLDADRQCLRLLKKNLDGFRMFDNKIEARRDELQTNIEKMEATLKEIYNEVEWKFPSIEQRAIQSKDEPLQNIYNQSYSNLCDIEHHSTRFGEHYVDSKEYEPILEVNHLKYYPQFNSSVSLFLFRAVFIEILNIFNQEFRLNRETQISELRSFQEEEYPLLKELKVNASR